MQDDAQKSVKYKAALQSVLNERGRQLEKWDRPPDDLGTYHTIVSEELGEVAEAILKRRGAEGRTKDIYDVRGEFVQTAASALKAVQHIDRKYDTVETHNLPLAEETGMAEDPNSALREVLTERARQLYTGETPYERLAEYHRDLMKKLESAGRMLFTPPQSKSGNERIKFGDAREVFMDIAAFALQVAEDADEKRRLVLQEKASETEASLSRK